VQWSAFVGTCRALSAFVGLRVAVGRSSRPGTVPPRSLRLLPPGFHILSWTLSTLLRFIRKGIRPFRPMKHATSWWFTAVVHSCLTVGKPRGPVVKISIRHVTSGVVCRVWQGPDRVADGAAHPHALPSTHTKAHTNAHTTVGRRWS
jgi:hypothetical protein